ncbi:hypothetical protein K439DRAFT_1662913 [Ramaria rubella]|nr:hypothetical protein K439DRAFT_1662913 [Ramaria rubella]
MALDNPPSYEYATDATKPIAPPPSKEQTQPIKPDAHEQPRPTMQAGPSYSPRFENVHHYVHPQTGEHIVTVLPPNHPEMICLQEGSHIKRTRFGILGVLAAVFWFPLGIGLCLLDRRVTCDRCGHTLENGLMCG